MIRAPTQLAQSVNALRPSGGVRSAVGARAPALDHRQGVAARRGVLLLRRALAYYRGAAAPNTKADRDGTFRRGHRNRVSSVARSVQRSFAARRGERSMSKALRGQLARRTVASANSILGQQPFSRAAVPAHKPRRAAARVMNDANLARYGAARTLARY